MINIRYPLTKKIPLTINNIKEPRFAYAVTKILGESAFLNYSKNFSFSSTIVRYHNVFGPDMGFKHVIPHLVERFIKERRSIFNVWIRPNKIISYISDVAEGSVLALESPHSKRRNLSSWFRRRSDYRRANKICRKTLQFCRSLQRGRHLSRLC